MALIRSQPLEAWRVLRDLRRHHIQAPVQTIEPISEFYADPIDASEKLNMHGIDSGPERGLDLVDPFTHTVANAIHAATQHGLHQIDPI